VNFLEPTTTSAAEEELIRKAGTQENLEVDRLVPKPMAADPTQRVGDNAFHLHSFLIQNLSRKDPNVKTLHLFSTE